MKKIILIVLTTVFYSCGTDQGDPIFYNYTITNNSGATVEIIPFNRQGDKVNNKKIILLNNQSINQNFKDLGPYVGYSMKGLLFNYFNNTPTTKIEITFINTKKLIYSECVHTASGLTLNCDELRNIFRNEYSAGKTETYTITSEDFQNATDCGGNCN